MEQTEQKNVMYDYKRDGKTCTTPNIDIAVARHDEGTTIYTTTFSPNGKTEVGTVTLN